MEDVWATTFPSVEIDMYTGGLMVIGIVGAALLFGIRWRANVVPLSCWVQGKAVGLYMCVDALEGNWSHGYGNDYRFLPSGSVEYLVFVFKVVLPQLLREPNPTDSLNNDAADLMQKDEELYGQKVKGKEVHVPNQACTFRKSDQGTRSKEVCRDEEDGKCSMRISSSAYLLPLALINRVCCSNFLLVGVLKSSTMGSFS
ncbi:hypothetical protein C3L33_14335, partial [Rhododendron williamsianum]